MSIVVLTDFDGTVLHIDTSVVILEKFAEENWRIYDEQLERGEISLQECIQRQFSTVRVSKVRILKETEGAMSTRPNFKALVQQCITDEIPFEIVSAGLDFVIEHFLEHNGWQRSLKVHAPKAKCTGRGIKFTFPKLLDKSSIDFKQDIVRHYRRQGRRVIYIGDGIGDYHAAQDADLVFAIKNSKLAEMLKKSKIPHTEISDSQEVVEALKRSTLPK